MFAAHAVKSPIPPAGLARYFTAMATWEVVLKRNCAMSDTPTKAQLRSFAEKCVDDFMIAFLRDG